MDKRFQVLSDYKRKATAYLRKTEAEMSRGDIARLAELETLTDDEVLRKWSWFSAISGAVAVYVACPILLSLLGPFLPHFLSALLWSIVKVAMAIVLVMFCLAIYFTVQVPPAE